MAFNGRTVLSKPDDGPVLGVSFIIFYNIISILVHTFVNLVNIQGRPR